MKCLGKFIVPAVLVSLLVQTTALAGGGGWTFSDVPEDYEYFEAINYFRGQEILFGDMDTKDEDGMFMQTYRPEDELNRAEFATLMYRVAPSPKFLASSEYHDCFPDVENEWFAPYVCWAKERGYVSGFKEGDLAGKYGPSEPIRMGEIATVLSRIYNWETEEAPEWYAPAMNYGQKHNLLNETPFENAISRGYIAEVLYRALAYDQVKTGAYIQGNTVDLDTLSYIKGFYLKDKNAVYDETGKIIPEISPDTVEVYSNYVVKDEDTVYHSWLGTLENIDAASFEQVRRTFFKDSNSVYQFPSDTFVNLTDQEGFNPDTFEVLYHTLPPYYPEAYVKNGDSVYYVQKSIFELEDSDASTFKVIPDDYIKYTKDANHVYQDGFIVEGADPDTFEVLDAYGVYNFAKDKNNVYFNGVAIADADVNTFEVIDFGYSKDDTQIYFGNLPLEDSDYDSFEYIDTFYAKDANHAYYSGNIIEDIDISTFEYVEHGYYKDKDAVYFNRQAIEGIDPATFEYAGSYYVKDANHVYNRFEDFAIEEQFDVSGFEEYLNGYAKDENNVYYDKQIIEEADPATFEFITSTYAKDKNHCYNYGQIMEGEDPAYFTVSR